MSYSAEAKLHFRQCQGVNVYLEEMRARVKQIHAQGVSGWDCIHQAVADSQLSHQASTEEQAQGVSRVAIAFNRLAPHLKVGLLMMASYISERKGVRFTAELSANTTFQSLNTNERAAVASALFEMGVIRENFPPNLRRNDFHQ